MLGYINSILKYFYYLFLYVYDVLFYIFVKKISIFNIDTTKEYKLFNKTIIFLKKFNFLKALENNNFLNLDILENFLFFINKPKNLIFSRYSYRSKIYFKKNSNLINEKNIFKSQFMSGLYSIHNALKYWYLPLILSVLTIYVYICTRVVSVNTMLFQWFVLGMFAYWLLSGFVFFIKKYRFTRFTSSIQRFWRRSYILFWLIESCLLLVFFYLTINATQEPSYMLDQINSFKTHTYSWKYFLPKLFLLSILIILGYIFLLNIKYNIFNKNIIFLIIISLMLTYLLWTEFYQIYHVSNFYANLFWNYDVEEKFWSIDSDARRTRIVNHYVMILFLLKFWHIVIIYAFWIFFLLRSNELGRIRYPLYSVNFQNFIILYIMTWLFMYPWLKLILHRFIEVPYFWFYVNNRDLFFRVFVFDIKLLCDSIIDFNSMNNSFFFYKNFDFFYWVNSDYSTGFNNFRKHTIRNVIINNLIK